MQRTYILRILESLSKVGSNVVKFYMSFSVIPHKHPAINNNGIFIFQ